MPRRHTRAISTCFNGKLTYKCIFNIFYWKCGQLLLRTYLTQLSVHRNIRPEFLFFVLLTSETLNISRNYDWQKLFTDLRSRFLSSRNDVLGYEKVGWSIAVQALASDEHKNTVLGTEFSYLSIYVKGRLYFCLYNVLCGSRARLNRSISRESTVQYRNLYIPVLFSLTALQQVPQDFLNEPPDSQYSLQVLIAVIPHCIHETASAGTLYQYTEINPHYTAHRSQLHHSTWCVSTTMIYPKNVAAVLKKSNSSLTQDTLIIGTKEETWENKQFWRKTRPQMITTSVFSLC